MSEHSICTKSLPTGLTANAAAARLQYSGEWWDYGLQMSDNRARPYDPATGRFPIRDVYEGTIDDPQSLHRHLYRHDLSLIPSLGGAARQAAKNLKFTRRFPQQFVKNHPLVAPAGTCGRNAGDR